jgi:hypothetical protein
MMLTSIYFPLRVLQAHVPVCRDVAARIAAGRCHVIMQSDSWYGAMLLGASLVHTSWCCKQVLHRLACRHAQQRPACMRLVCAE